MALEWDITAIPIPQLTLDWSGSYLDARYTNFAFVPPPGYLQPTGTNNLSGTPFPLPAWQTNATANYSFGLHADRRVSGQRPGLHGALLLAKPLSGGIADYNPSQETSPTGC